MSDHDLVEALQDADSFRRYVDTRLIEVIEADPEIQADRREYAEWEDKVINGDPSANDTPRGIIRA